MDVNKLGGLSFGKNEIGADGFGFHAAHADFNAESLGFVAGSYNASVFGDAVSNGDWATAQHGASLLFDGGKTRIEINIHDGVLVAGCVCERNLAGRH